MTRTKQQTGGGPSCLLLVVVCVLAILLPSTFAGATTWPVALRSGSSGQSDSLTPSPPTSVSATCTSSTGSTVTVSWAAAPHANSYLVYVSTSASGTYSLDASGILTTSWTSGSLAKGDYYFEVEAGIGTYWTSVLSSATPEVKISSSGCKVE